MRFMKTKLSSLIAMLLVMILMTNCADLDIQNLNQPDRAAALSNPDDLNSLLEGGTVGMFNGLMSSQNATLYILADQVTMTNAVRNFWGYSEEDPRQRITNQTTWDDLATITQHWGAMNTAVSVANDIITFIVVNENEMILSDGTDVTQKALAGAYMLRGIAQAYIGVIYDQGFIVNEDTDLGAIELVSYDQMIDAGVESIELAKAIYQANPDINWDYLENTDFSSAEAIQICNSYAARCLIAKPRDPNDPVAMDYAQIRTYAQNGIETDWNPIGTDNFNNGDFGWTNFDLAGFDYLPVDIKIPHLANTLAGDGTQPGPGTDDNSPYPKGYYLDEATVLDPVETDDDRIEEYFYYSTNFGILRSDRNRRLFSNYGHFRFDYNYQVQNTGNPMHIMHAVEMDYIEAECELMLGNNDAAKAILDSGPRSTVGNLPPLPDNSVKTLSDALHYEYSIELDQLGKGIHLAFMRRHGYLQEGTATQFPVPAGDLELLNLDPYNFGGNDFAGQDPRFGTATVNPNTWRLVGEYPD